MRSDICKQHASLAAIQVNKWFSYKGSQCSVLFTSTLHPMHHHKHSSLSMSRTSLSCTSLSNLSTSLQSAASKTAQTAKNAAKSLSKVAKKVASAASHPFKKARTSTAADSQGMNATLMSDFSLILISCRRRIQWNFISPAIRY